MKEERKKKKRNVRFFLRLAHGSILVIRNRLALLRMLNPLNSS